MPVKKQRDKAFSLTEVLVSILLLAGLISIIVQLSYGNTRRIKKSKKMEKIANLLEIKMRELEEEFRGEKIVHLAGRNEGSFEEEENYFWNYETQPLDLPPPDLLMSLLQLTQSELNAKMTQTFISVLSKTVIELKLTVHWKGKRGEKLAYSLVSYFINYEDAPDFIFNHIGELFPANDLDI